MPEMTIQQALELARQRHQAADPEQAVAICRQILQAQPGSVEAHHFLSMLLYEAGQFAEAEQSLRQVLKLQPDRPDVMNDLGTALRMQGKLDEAIPLYRRSLAMAPDYAMAHYNFGLALLQLGHLLAGFNEIQWRWKIPGLKLFNQELPRPWWDGSPLNGQRILLREEQGFGDTIHFARYVQLVHERAGGRVVLACRPPLVRLFRRLGGVEQIITQGDPLVPFDVHSTLLSLPALFGTTVDTIPAPIPYLKADPALAAEWRTRIGSDPGAAKIGLVWAGALGNTNDCMRSVPSQMFSALSRLEGVRLFSLQKGGDSESQISDLKSQIPLVDWTGDLQDFADTAALIENLDLVITVDTAVAHLAGAMGKPVWVLVTYVADWRWMRDRSDSPWYPTMRLFRQPRPGDWKTPIERVVQEVKCLR
jgi:hypothetical protein